MQRAILKISISFETQRMVLHRFESPENTNQNRDRHPCGCEIGGTLSIRQEPVAVLKPPLVPEVGVEQPQFSPVKTASDENGGHPGGHFDAISETVARLKEQVITDLNRAIATMHVWESIEYSSSAAAIVTKLRGIVSRMEKTRD
jgi:hypothetical protein